jgi:hypothetical protein
MAVEYQTIQEQKSVQRVKRTSSVDKGTGEWNIAPEALARQGEKTVPQIIWVAEPSPLSTLLPTGEIFPNYSAKGMESAPLLDDLDSSITTRADLERPKLRSIKGGRPKAA